jgi:PDZ domain-containing protein
MTRRTAVLAAGSALLLLFGLLGTAVPVPYVAQIPGPTYNTLGDIDGAPVITLEGRERDDVSGNLNLTTVGVSGGGVSLVQAVRGWFDPKVSVVPEESVYPPDRTEEETRRVNREAFLTSEEAATGVALGHLGYPVKVVVRGLTEGAPAADLLEEGDAIESVDGRATPDVDGLTGVLRGIPAGSEIEVGYLRRGQARTATVTTAPAPDRDGSLLGVSVRDMPSAPFGVDIQVADVGGPSAGLMLTLGIIELIGEEDLTGGALIAGSGTIDPEGAVGPIGGIELKVISAADLGADLFLVPAANCRAVLSAGDPPVPTARVANLDDALAALADLRAGRTPTPC